MSEAHHDLAHEFPEFKERIHALKTSDSHFLRLADEYHDVVKTIHRSEIGVEAHADSVLEELKKRRLLLKDELFAMLKTN